MSNEVAFPVIDGHNDSLRYLTPSRAESISAFLSGRSPGHVDLLRAKRGGLRAGFFAIYVPPNPNAPVADGSIVFTADGYEVPLAEPLDAAYAREAASAALTAVLRLEAAAAGQVRIARHVTDIEDAVSSGTLAIIVHLEGAEAIDRDLDALEVFFQAGLRSLGPVWSRPNIFGTGVPFRFPHTPDTGPGLTAAGKELVRACNRLGIMLDASHLNERGFWDLAKESAAPLVATHSAAHALCPCSRNLTDRQLDAIRDTGGVVGVNFEVSALRPDGANDPDTPVEVLIRHIDYMVKRMGIDHVAFGSDFDGATMSHELPDVAALPRLIEALRERSYDFPEIEKLAHRNWLRVLRSTWSPGPT